LKCGSNDFYRYQEVVTETLTNLFKVADSLKKLQRRNRGKDEQGAEEDDDSKVLSTSDEGKCVLQYELDVEAFGKKVVRSQVVADIVLISECRSHFWGSVPVRMQTICR